METLFTLKIKKWINTVLLFLTVAIFSSCSAGVWYQIYMERTFEIYSTSLRFHVRAENDSKKAQESKLAVRDTVLALLKDDVKEASSAKELEQKLAGRLDEIEETAKKELQKIDGACTSQQVRVYFVTERFPIRQYGAALFPAGSYRALRVDIGEAKGHNWWCAFYPDLCYTSKKHFSLTKKGWKDVKKALSKKEWRVLFGKKIKFRFKILKWFGNKF